MTFFTNRVVVNREVLLKALHPADYMQYVRRRLALDLSHKVVECFECEMQHDYLPTVGGTEVSLSLHVMTSKQLEEYVQNRILESKEGTRCWQS